MDIKALYKETDIRPNILSVIHDFRYVKGGSVGGTTLHLMDIIDGLRERYNFHVLYWSANTGKYHITSFFEQSEVTKVLGDFSSHRKEPWLKLYSKDFKDSVAEAVDALKIDVIHVHHIKNMFLDVFNVAKTKEIPLIYSVHDFYSICPSINLMREDNSSCHLKGNRECKVCSQKKFGIDFSYIELWQKEFGSALESASKIVAPADSTKKILQSEYPSLNIDVIEHGYNINVEPNKKDINNEILNIAFVGSITKIKGLNLFVNLIPLVKGSKIRVHLFGTSHKISITSDGINYINHGRYEREDLPKLLIDNNIDIVCLPSICAETFSYTLSESFMCNIPVIALNIGAIAERIRRYDAGWVLPINTDAKQLFDFIEDIRTNKREEYLLKRENLKKHQVNMPSVAAMCSKYMNIYDSYIKNREERSKASTLFFENEDSFSIGVEIDKEGREEYRNLRDKITSENLSYKSITKEIKEFRKHFPESKLRNKIIFKLLWHKLSHKKM